VNFDPGAVHLDVRYAAGRIGAVSVRSRRVRAAHLLRGRPANAVAALLPLVFAICARGQSAGSRAALTAAAGAAPSMAVDAEAAAEAAREHVLAVLTGDARGLAPQARRCATAPDLLRAFLESQVIGMEPERWLELESTEALARWAERSDTACAREARVRLALPEPEPSRIALLAPIDAQASLACWPRLGADFVARPSLHGQPAETGAVARQISHPLVRDLAPRPFLQRWAARLIEVIGHACEDPATSLGRVTAATAEPGRGRASVETARGLLLHEVSVADDVVTDYAIVAPTEWNFHPDGVARRWLEGAPVASSAAALELARRAAEALDPCVECRRSLV
jgi:hypothetical protein